MTTSPPEQRAANAEHQRTWRQRHPDQERAQQALKRWKQRRWRIEAGWVPLTPAQRGRLGGTAQRRAS